MPCCCLDESISLKAALSCLASMYNSVCIYTFVVLVRCFVFENYGYQFLFYSVRVGRFIREMLLDDLCFCGTCKQCDNYVDV